MSTTTGSVPDDRPVLVRPLDRHQARLVELLHAAGRPLSFEELHAQGVENPAVLAYELEIAGVPVRHVQRLHAGRMPVPVGLELEPSWIELSSGEPAERERGAAVGRAVRRAETAGAMIRARLPRESPVELERFRAGSRRAALWLGIRLESIWIAATSIAGGLRQDLVRRVPAPGDRVDAARRALARLHGSQVRHTAVAGPKAKPGRQAQSGAPSERRAPGSPASRASGQESPPGTSEAESRTGDGQTGSAGGEGTGAGNTGAPR
jgi:hypothetical protein